MTTITEIVPDLDTMPDWFRDAFESGQVFSVALATVAELEAKIDDAEHEAQTKRDENVKLVHNILAFAELHKTAEDELKVAEEKWWDAGIIWAAAFMVLHHREESYAEDILLHSRVNMKNGVDYDVDIIKKALPEHK